LFLREAEFVNQALKGVRLFDRVEIFALEIFYQRHFQGHFLRHVPNYDWHAKQARTLSRTPAALSCNELEAAGNFANHERLHDAAGMDGAGKLVQRFFAEAGTRLIGARINQINV
jgi:hypothetical protein